MNLNLWINRHKLFRNFVKKGLRHKKWAKKRSFFLNSQPETVRKEYLRQNQHKIGSIKIKMGETFSLKENVEEVLLKIDSLKKAAYKGNKIITIDFRKTKKISPAALAVLLSVYQDLKESKIHITFKFPIDSDAKKDFLTSGFHEYFFPDDKTNFSSKNKILVQIHGEDKINQIRTAEEIKKAMKTVFDIEVYHTRMQGAVVEMMANSVNHAFFGDKFAFSKLFSYEFAKNKNWHFSISHDEERKIVSFCFIDNGNGIINTVQNKNYKIIKNFFSDQSLLEAAYKGEFGSRTQLPGRGKGLVTIKKAFDEQGIKNLKVITNFIHYDFATNMSTKLTNGFEGTFYLWQLDTSCNYV